MYYTDGKRIVEAVQINLDNLIETHELLNSTPYNIHTGGITVLSDGVRFHIPNGDYLLKINDNFHSCNADKFKQCYRLVTVETTEEKLAGMNSIKDTQEANLGDCSDEYMVGLYNGMEFMIAIMEDREPLFKDIAISTKADAKDDLSFVHSLLSCFSDVDIITHMECRNNLRHRQEPVRDETIKHDGPEVYLKQDNGQMQDTKYMDD
jgi:hypothetical protein